MLLALQQNLLLGDVTLVEVPDVVGETQGDGTTTLEAAGFQVAVQTAHSSVVAAGTIISQDPAGGVEYPEGGSVSIVVSLGDQPVADQGFTGGFVVAYERELARRRRDRKRRQELEEEAERIEEETTREIAQLLREQEAKDARRAELNRLSELVDAHVRRSSETALSERVQKAIEKAAAKQTTWALYALERELRRAQEEEDFVIQALRFVIEND